MGNWTSLCHLKISITFKCLTCSSTEGFIFPQTWDKIVEEECEDVSYNVFQYIANTLNHMEHKPIILKFVDWVLQREQNASFKYCFSSAGGRSAHILCI